MKKSILIVLVLLLLLTACQVVPDDDQSLASTPSSSSSITPPPSSSVVPPTSSAAPTVPTTQPTVPTTQPTVPATVPVIQPITQPAPLPVTNPTSTGVPTPSSTGYVDIRQGSLYWFNKKTSESTLVVAEEIRAYEADGAYIYYVKKAEPNKIYRTLIGDFSQQELLHETSYSEVCNLNVTNAKNYLQFVADYTKFIVYELNTGEEIVLMEQHYLAWGYVAKSEENVLSPYIVFYGRPTEDSWYTSYRYNYLTGKTEINEDGDGPDW